MGICQKVNAKGASCFSSDECQPEYSCLGAAGSMICVANAAPSQPCSSNPADTTPMCGTGLFCGPSNTCIGGYMNDLCSQNTDCAGSGNLYCSTSKNCTAAADGAKCASNYDCLPTSYCPPTGVSPVCTAKLTSGTCTDPSQCATNYYCVASSPTDTTQCVQQGTLAAGIYCQNPETCKSNRCVNSLCATKTTKYCIDDFECAGDESCTCGGLLLFGAGVGTCKKNPCYDLGQKFSTCMTTNCNTPYEMFTYDNSCISSNCLKEWQSLMVCAPAGTVVLSSLLILASVVISFFFSK